MKNTIFTVSDEKYGDFLINNWLKSLQANVNLKNIDIIVLDYGLSIKQRKELKQRKVIVCKFKRDGHVNVLRFRDMAEILEKRNYDQVMSVDGGDVIFQTDINKLFEKNKNTFRATYEDLRAPFGVFVNTCFSKEDSRKIKQTLKGKKMINAGVILAPKKLFSKLCKEAYKMITKKIFGPDQVAINYILHRDGFKELSNKYNFVVTTTKKKFRIKKGKFLTKDNKLIPVIHNAGGKNFLRPIKNFGYGEDKNKIKQIRYLILRNIMKISNLKKN